MKIVSLLFLFFFTVSFLEIYLLLQLGDIVGIFPTILLVIFTALLGAWLLKQQGFATWKRFQDNLNHGEIPAYEMIEGPLLLVGGALLLTPGFFTDILGFVCLIPQTRRFFAKAIFTKYLLHIQHNSPFQSSKSKHNTLEGEFKRED